MCTFLTVGVPAAEIDVLIRSIPRGLMIFPVANRSLAPHLSSDIRTYLLISGGCSCDLFRDRVTEDPGAEESMRAKQRRRYQKQGWSDAKIARALGESAAHSKNPLAPKFIGLRPDVRELLARVAAQVREMVILAHFYNDDYDVERIDVKPGARLTPEQLRVAELPDEDDQLLRVSARFGRSLHRRHQGG